MSTSTHNEKKFSKMLVAVDGSEPSMDAAEYGIFFAQKYDADLIALHVSPKIISSEYYEDDDIRTNKSILGGGIAELPRLEIEEKSFRKIKEKCKQNNVRVITEVVISNKSVAADIIDYAENNNVNLIVVGTKGRTGFKRLLLGSIVSGVVTYAHCPVLVVR
jgi:nucleotide-binding universal stress UspA family protein